MRRFVCEYRLSSIQNAMAAAVFGVLLTAQLSAFLLYLNPRSEWLWFLSVEMNRISDPILPFYDQYVSVGPLLSCALLAALCAVPLRAQVRRNWLGAFLSGHLALLVCISSAVDQLEQAAIHYNYASLDSFAGAATLNWGTTTVITATAALLIVCPLNQFFYWKTYWRRQNGNGQRNAHHRTHPCICKYSVSFCYLTRWMRQASNWYSARRNSMRKPILGTLALNAIDIKSG